MKKKVSLLLALGLFSVSALSGCGGGQSDQTEPQTIAAPTTEAATTAAEAACKDGGIIIMTADCGRGCGTGDYVCAE